MPAWLPMICVIGQRLFFWSQSARKRPLDASSRDPIFIHLKRVTQELTQVIPIEFAPIFELLEQEFRN